jgi:hypothetical protein
LPPIVKIEAAVRAEHVELLGQVGTRPTSRSAPLRPSRSRGQPAHRRTPLPETSTWLRCLTESWDSSSHPTDTSRSRCVGTSATASRVRWDS